MEKMNLIPVRFNDKLEIGNILTDLDSINNWDSYDYYLEDRKNLSALHDFLYDSNSDWISNASDFLKTARLIQKLDCIVKKKYAVFAFLKFDCAIRCEKLCRLETILRLEREGKLNNNKFIEEEENMDLVNKFKKYIGLDNIFRFDSVVKASSYSLNKTGKFYLAHFKVERDNCLLINSKKWEELSKKDISKMGFLEIKQCIRDCLFLDSIENIGVIIDNLNSDFLVETVRVDKK